MSSGNSLAMALLVRDEEHFLEANLHYHRRLGVERAYVFCDRCSDRSPQIARSLSWVRTFERPMDPDARYMSEHQVTVMDEAVGLARSDGHEWLLHVDADELAHPDDTGRDHPDASLRDLVAGANPSTDQLILRPLEAVPRRLADRGQGGAASAFDELRDFQVRGALRWPTLDPRTGARRRIRDLLGHYKGKSIVRTRPGARASSAHRWQIDGREPVSQWRGSVFHYPVVSPQQWQAKYARFSRFPSRWSSGRPVREPKQLWKEIAADLDPAETDAYFDRWVVPPRHRVALARARGRVVRRDTVARVLERSER